MDEKILLQRYEILQDAQEVENLRQAYKKCPPSKDDGHSEKEKAMKVLTSRPS